jgi:NAD(P)-dependent dehydrogenase (short-subunit alcohol dehydrogenase family)
LTHRDLFDLSGKSIVIIGGGGHICSRLAYGLAEYGAGIAIADLRFEKSQLVARKLERIAPLVKAYQVDATRRESLEILLSSVIQDFKKIDVLINGAGINSPKPFMEIDESDWHAVVDSQLTATFLGSQTFSRHFLECHEGNIINISSASAEVPLSRAFAYSAAKAAIRNLTKNLAREWAPLGIRVNALRPGFFPTEWNRKNFITPEREASILKHTPMNRFGNPDELVGAAIFLASKASSFVTGSELIVDGGFSAMTI